MSASRPNPATIRQVEECLAVGMTRELAAAAAGVPLSTFYRWLSQGETASDGPYRHFWEAVKRGEARTAMGALKTIHARAMPRAKDSVPECETCGRSARPEELAGEFHAAAWLMERRYGYRRDAPPPAAPEDWADIDLDSEEGQRTIAGALDALLVSQLAGVLLACSRRRLQKALEMAGFDLMKRKEAG
jgi:hypothetical protein